MQKNQNGRSMVEMLGVLAIVGVLSIGGIALYRRAVNNHQANTILDDANRFAFVIMESGRAFSTNAFIDNIEYSQASTYNLDAFLGTNAGQFGIVVTDVRKGVCEPLVDKASVEYKVRVLSANTAESVAQLSASGTIYDSLHKDICANDMNDVVLYFGDTSTQCNKPDESGYTPCTTNADCCGGYFCAFQNPLNCSVKGDGTCMLIDDFRAGSITVVANGTPSTWVRTTTHNGKWQTWWSAQNWCLAQGLTPVTRKDIGCNDILGSCPESEIFERMREKWGGLGAHHLEDLGNSCSNYLVYFLDGGTISLNSRIKQACGLCH